MEVLQNVAVKQSVLDVLKQKCLEKIEDELIVYSEVSDNPQISATSFSENILEIILSEINNPANRINVININAN